MEPTCASKFVSRVALLSNSNCACTHMHLHTQAYVSLYVCLTIATARDSGPWKRKRTTLSDSIALAIAHIHAPHTYPQFYDRGSPSGTSRSGRGIRNSGRS